MNQKRSILTILINFFASLYDLVIASFAFLYDTAYNFICFLGEYVKWVSTIQSKKPADLKTTAEEETKVNQNSIKIH